MFSTIGYWICVPFAWLVRLFYTLTRSYGMAVILFTVVLKLILLPFQMKSKKSMIRMSRMSGKMQEIQKKYANNQQKMNEEIQRLYEEEGVNPMSGCLWSFLPLPILIALYAIIRDPVTRFMMLSMETLEEIIQRLTAAGADMSSIVRMQDGAAVVASNGFTQLIPFGQINLVRLVTEEYPQVVSDINGWINVSFRSFGLDLASTPSSQISSFTFTWGCIGLILIPVVTGLSQFLMSLITMKQQPQQDPNAAATSRSMMFFMPLFSVWISCPPQWVCTGLHRAVCPPCRNLSWDGSSTKSLKKRKTPVPLPVRLTVNAVSNRDVNSRHNVKISRNINRR